MYRDSFSIIAIVLVSWILHVSGDANNPIRYNTEEQFLKAKSHERSETVEEMQKKISVIRERRKFVPWDPKNPAVAKHLGNSTKIDKKTGKPFRPPNIILMLADDLGYGDLSVPPFTTVVNEANWPCVEGGILSPNLERMAKQGATMTNFHSAAPVCSPARTAIMTGLYPWRMTAMNAFELGRDMSQRHGFLPQIPTGTEILREHGYYTMHSGKWHLGGMREELRLDRAVRDQCSRPSPNQHGFEEYVSELDGPESPRYTFLLRNRNLHSLGHKYLLKDDVPVPIIEKSGVQNVLSDREAGDAIDAIREMQKTRPEQPWFMNIWFNAPHGPWELLSAGEELYNKKYNKTSEYWSQYVCKPPQTPRDTYTLYRENWWYKTMVSAMDKSIGDVLDVVKELGIEENTLIVFTSDNGNEMGAGGPGMFKEGKRSLMEGGVRVPTIIQWKGTIAENSYSPYFGAHTDLIPTFLDAAGIPKPEGVSFDGISLMSVLTKTTPINSAEELYGNQFKHAKHLPGEKEIKNRYFKHVDLEKSHSTGGKTEPEGRVFLWHKDTDPFSRDQRMQSAGYYEYIKIITSTGKGCIDRIFDMRHDPLENVNLVAGHHRSDCYANFHNYDKMGILQNLVPANIAHDHCADMIKHNVVHDVLGKPSEGKKHQKGAAMGTEEEQALNACMDHYYSILIHKLNIILDKLSAFVWHGNEGHQQYMNERINKATCNIPVASDLKSMDYTRGKDCSQNQGRECSRPEF